MPPPRTDPALLAATDRRTIPVRVTIKRAIAKTGYLVERGSLSNRPALRRAALLQTSGISTVLDVGANVGAYGLELRQYGYQGRIVSFEPLSIAHAQLKATACADDNWDTQRIALSDETGQVEINVSASHPWSSLLPADSCAAEPERLEKVGTETVATATLDSLDGVLTGRSWLKLDVQGFELHALRGAERSLDRIEAVECEICLEPFYVGQSTMREVIDFLDDRGFTPATVTNGWVRESGRARWIDVVFTRT